MLFVLDRGKYVNLAHAVTGEVVESRGVRAVVLRDVHGREVATVREEALNPPDILIAGPLAAVSIDVAGEIQWRPVVAWRVGRQGAEPVIAGSRPPGVMFIEFASGELLGNGQRYTNLKEAACAVAAPEVE